MLLKAVYEPQTVSLKVNSGYSTIKLERGQFIFGRDKAVEQLELNGSMIYRILKLFENDGSISIKSNNKYSIITICKYDSYNSQENEIEQPVNSQRTASEQPVNTYKKDKKEKKEKEVFMPPTVDEVVAYFVENGYADWAGAKAHKYYDTAKWIDSKGSPVRNWKQKMISVWFKDENKAAKVEVLMRPRLVH